MSCNFAMNRYYLPVPIVKEIAPNNPFFSLVSKSWPENKNVHRGQYDVKLVQY